jgi:O-antigen/teichoic acid export membrane protein
MDIVANLSQCVLVVAAWYTAKLNNAVAWSIIGGTFIPSIIMGMYWVAPGRPSPEAFLFTWAHHRKKGSWLLASSLLQWCSDYFFILVGGWWLGVAALGVLRLAQYNFGLLSVLLQAVENYTLPKAAAATEPVLYFRMLLKKCLLLFLPFLLLLSLFAKQVLQLEGGSGYTGYAYVIYGLSLVYLIVIIGFPVRIALRSFHLNRQYFTGYVIAVVFSLSCAPFLVRNWQLYGVLAGLFLTQLITVGYWYAILHYKNIRSSGSFT